MFRSVFAVLLGALISLLIGTLVIQGILAPVFSAFFGLEPSQSVMGRATPLLVFVAAFSFYWGGMAAGYRARSHRRLHGVAVVVVMSLISPALNLIAGRAPLPQLESASNVLIAAALLIFSIGAAYVGASRSAALYAFNQRPAHERVQEHARKRRAGRFFGGRFF